MEDLQAGVLCAYGKDQNHDIGLLGSSKDNQNECSSAHLNGSDDIDETLDLIDECETASIASNSDVWKGSDSEEESSDTVINTGIVNTVTDPVTEKVEKEENVNSEPQTETPDTNPVKDEEKSKKSDKSEVMDISKEGAKTEIDFEEEIDTLASMKSVLHKPHKKISNNEKETDKSGKVDVCEIKNTKDYAEKEEVEDEAGKNKSQLNANEDEVKNDTNKETTATEKPLNTEDDEMDYDDEDFDPSLLCPEVSMDVGENQIVTNGSSTNDDNDNSDGQLLYEPTMSTFVDEITGAEVCFNLTDEEQELRKRTYTSTNLIQYNRIHCTACNVHLGSALEGQNNRFVHPLLKVLICKECYQFYTSGDFEKDEDGSELYCRWCGQGGQVLCCSKCEFVFCKRCIRNNFGRKKMVEIRDSDNWDCFRCNQSQIIPQRISCFEFFEYIRKEMQRIAHLQDHELWSKDYTGCCNGKKRLLENCELKEVPKKAKRRKIEDPDYDPVNDKVESVPAVMAANFLNSVVSKIPITKPPDNDIEFVRQIPPPLVTITPNIRPTYRPILPNSVNVRPVTTIPTMLRISAQPVVRPQSQILSSVLQNRSPNVPTPMKHYWFEKTVRAAARVNSHLSYTLTQLNKAQSQAASVEELAVVHNKLQEILSSSINSLIQIRKNLRNEFIAGIKTVRLPAVTKKAELIPNNSDDDVILVSAPATMPMPSTSGVPINEPLIIIENPKTIGECRVTSKMMTAPIKVRSLESLENVPAECITIPDDPAKEDEVVDLNETDPLALPECKTTSEGKEENVEINKEQVPSVDKPSTSATVNEESEDVKIEKTDEKLKMTIKVHVVRDDLQKLQKTTEEN